MILFHYIPADSLIHKTNPKTKLLSIIIFSFGTLRINNLFQNYYNFLMLLIVLLSILIIAKIPLRYLLKDMRYFLIMFPIIVLINSFKLSTDESSLLSFISIEGLNYSLSFCFKLYLFSLISIIFIATTTVRQINFAIENILRKFPLVPSVKIATMISLCIIQIPLIFDNYNSIILAQKSRCMDNVKNPFKRFQLTLIPLISKTLKKADNISLNYQAKCYSHTRTQYSYKLELKDYIILGIFSLYSFMSVKLAL